MIVGITSSDANAAAAKTVALTVAGATRTFTHEAGLSQTPISFGVYIPSSATGMVGVSASAMGSGFCLWGSTTETVPSAGSTVITSLDLIATADCTGGGGTGGGGLSGTGGSSGTAGASGSGGGAGTSGRGGAGGGAGGSSEAVAPRAPAVPPEQEARRPSCRRR